MEHGHIYRPFDNDLQGLKNRLLEMGGLVEAHISEALRALVERDPERARRVIEEDRAVNRMELAIDEQCVRLLALRQPAASDLRFVAASLKIVTDLERIGDLARNTADRAIALCRWPPLSAVVDLPAMGEAAQRMLRDALDAFVTGDAAKAERVLAADDTIDRWLATVFQKITSEIRRDPENVDRALSTLFIAKHIERLADHVVNVAEMVLYVVRGKDVRHGRST